METGEAEEEGAAGRGKAVAATIAGPQCLKYFLAGALQIEFANAC